MSSATRMIALTMVVATALAGPLAPLAAAQQASPPAGTAEGSTKTGQGSLTAYDVGAGVMNALYVPGKAVLCTVGVGFSTVLLIVTFGTAYKAVTAIVEEGCTGKWILTGEDIKPDQPVRAPGDWLREGA